MISGIINILEQDLWGIFISSVPLPRVAHQEEGSQIKKIIIRYFTYSSKPDKNKGRQQLLKPFVCFSRDDKIRTCDPLHPMQVRYQAAPHPDFVCSLLNSWYSGQLPAHAWERVSLKGAANIAFQASLPKRCRDIVAAAYIKASSSNSRYAACGISTPPKLRK